MNVDTAELDRQAALLTQAMAEYETLFRTDAYQKKYLKRRVKDDAGEYTGEYVDLREPIRSAEGLRVSSAEDSDVREVLLILGLEPRQSRHHEPCPHRL
jgi:hypothetical protein